MQALLQEVQALKLALGADGSKVGKRTPAPKTVAPAPSPMRTPPKAGEPHTKAINRKSRQWCAKCGRWTVSHGTADHKFLAKLKASRANESPQDPGCTVVAGKLLAPVVGGAPLASTPVTCNSTVAPTVDLLDLCRAPTPTSSNAAGAPTVGGFFATMSPFDVIPSSAPVGSTWSADLIDLSRAGPPTHASHLELAHPRTPVPSGWQPDAPDGPVVPPLRHPEGTLTLAGGFPFMLNASDPDASDDKLSMGAPNLVSRTTWFDDSDSDAGSTASAKSTVS